MSQALAQYHIEVLTKGLDEANRRLVDVEDKLKKGEQAAKQQEKAIASLSQKIVAFGGVAANVYSTVYGWITKFTSAAMANTVEQTQLAKSFEILNRQIGNIFAPYVRALISLIRDLTKWWKDLSPEVKQTIAQVAIGVVAFTSLAVIGPVVVSILSSMLTVVTALLGPFGLLVGAVVLISKALLENTDVAADWAETFGTAMAWVIAIWETVKGAFLAGMKFIEVVLTNIVKFVWNVATNWGVAWKWIRDNWWKLLTDMFHNAWTIVKNIANLFKELAEAVWKWIKSGFKQWDFDFADQFKKLADGIRSSIDPLPDVLTKGLKDPIKEAANVWHQQTDGIAMRMERNKRNLTDMARDMGKALDRAKQQLSDQSGFRFQGDVGFEDFKGSVNRLQLAFASPNGRDQLMQAQLNAMQDNAKLTQVVAANTGQMVNRLGMGQ